MAYVLCVVVYAALSASQVTLGKEIFHHHFFFFLNGYKQETMMMFYYFE